MTGPATKAARSARAIPLQPRPSRCRPPAVRRSACPWGSRGRNANASAGHVRDDHQPFNTPSGKRFGNLLIAPDVVEPLPRAPACRRSGTGGRRSRIRHKCRPRKASRSRHARVPEKGPVEGAPVRTLYCSRYGGGNRSRTGLQTGRSARPCVRRPPRKDRPLPVRLFQRGARPRNHPSGRTTPSYAALPPFGTGGASVRGFAPKGKRTARIRAVKKGFLGEAGRNP